MANQNSPVYEALKALGNLITPINPHGNSFTKNPTRGAIPDFLASQIYQSPQDASKIVSPLANTPNMPMQAAAKTLQPQAQAAENTPNANQAQLFNQIKNGFSQYGSPMATASGDFAEFGNRLREKYPKADPLLAAVLSLKESSGGKHMSPNSANNTLNIGPNINYPDIKTNLLGGGTWGPNGGAQQGLWGVLQNPAYQKYLKSGDLHDFFPVYTPTYGANGKKENGALEDQIKQYNILRQVFNP